MISRNWNLGILVCHTILLLPYMFYQIMLFLCCFTSSQHLKSYGDGYRLVTVHTHGDFIVLPHWETRPSASWPPTQLHYPDTKPTSLYPILIMLSTWLGSDRYKLNKSLVWLNHRFELVLYRFGHRTGLKKITCISQKQMMHIEMKQMTYKTK